MPTSKLSPRASDMKRLRVAVAELRPEPLAPPVSRLIEQLFGVCESLERDVAGAEMQAAATRTQAEHLAAERDYLFEVMPVACVEVDIGGIILRANRAAAELLNTSGKHLVGRLLLHFAEDREDFRLFIQQLACSGQSPLSCFIRPRDQAPVPMECRAVARSAQGGSASLVFLTPALQAVPRRGGRSAAMAKMQERVSLLDGAGLPRIT